MDHDKLQKFAFDKMDISDGDVLSSDCDTLVFLLDNCEITIFKIILRLISCIPTLWAQKFTQKT